jgi:hypothetical protein
MNAHPSPAQLHQLLADQLGETARTTTTAHVDGCAICQAYLTSLTEDSQTYRWRQLLAANHETAGQPNPTEVRGERLNSPSLPMSPAPPAREAHQPAPPGRLQSDWSVENLVE